ncbi:hypothetical protein [Mycoplasma capricolum]|uniref:hypothetical protein n=1 Tax=Mycoplasma capricolum TaxID=2095 RepID=UPI003DA3089A
MPNKISEKSKSVESLTKQISDIKEKNEKIESLIKKIKNKKDELEKQVRLINEPVKGVIDKSSNIFSNIKVSVHKIDDINNLMNDWNNEPNSIKQKKITRKIRESEFIKLKEAYEQIEVDLKDLEEFDNKLEAIIKDFNKEFDDKFFDIEW